MRYITTITKNDVGKTILKINNERHFLGGLLDRIMSCDVGKQIYKKGTLYYIENQEQYIARIAKLNPNLKEQADGEAKLGSGAV